MEKDREGAAAVRTCERLADGARVVVDVAAVEGAAAADELVNERARRAQRIRRGERAERLSSFREGMSVTIVGVCACADGAAERNTPESRPKCVGTSSDLLE